MRTRTKREKPAKIINISKEAVALFARCAEVLKPPPRLTLSQWADKYRMFRHFSSRQVEVSRFP